MGSAADVVEISSDEEDITMARKMQWVGKLFDDDVDDRVDGDDFFDLVVMGELSAPPVLPQKDNSCGGDHAEDDDDCVVLDGDPDRATTIGGEKGSAGDSSSDELQIVAEKGPVACRDFPHSRHLCSNLPFSTTSHVKHCSMCHCFVCDAPAPCNYWGKGISLNDHCHATDKETRWKTLRQTFKYRSLPACHPEKRQNIVYPTVASFIHQDTECQVSLIQSQPSLTSNTGRSTLANRSPLLNATSQNQQRHTSVRVSLNGAQAISAPRASPATIARRSTSNVHTAQNTNSRGSFKRAGTASPGHTIHNANQFGSTAPTSTVPLMNKALPHVSSQPLQAIPRINTSHVSHPIQAMQRTSFSSIVQNNAPQRSLSAPISCQGQQGQPPPSCEVASNGVYGIAPQLTRCTSLMTQKTQLLPEPLMDVSTQSWQDILASVASDLGVLDDSHYSTRTVQSQQPARTPSQPPHASPNQGGSLHAEPVVSTINLMTSNEHDLLNHTTCAGVQTNPSTQTSRTLDPLNYQSSLVQNEVLLDGFVSHPADGLLVEAAHHRESSGLDSTSLVFDFELEDWA
ncbi:uncharacterized protein LOC100828814 [Brachypodium distachyon]|uniref:RPM1 interacting protein 13 n=1 Tax=Brachypodium distachyon TaxID=15368 RepID=I1I4J0_BRADI|nr:uncharacterized protein LOC100828814 [Brachypodium distachyon]XP_010234803.1 uncharacterized protein LOC100828814 [Brachypodium distachyon]KQJ96999.1 hypothetical protein BRADI_3g28250v3 [Brachypodium distachyon]|eukprot:XP_003574022.1 uncharacterized protein LOC100828814 [Brachypodium distachyon]